MTLFPPNLSGSSGWISATPKGEWRGTWFRNDQTRIAVEAEAAIVADKITGRTGRVASVTTRKKRQPPPPLYALTDLQQAANQRFGLTAKATLQTTQNLYEQKKCLSYPRTDARVLGSGNVELVRTLVETLSSVYPRLFAGVDPALIHNANRRVFNDAKLTDHHALIPLGPLPVGASDSERKIYDLVLKRFVAAFHHDHEFEQTDVVTEVLAETFQTRGRRTLRPGWRRVYSNEDGRKFVPKDQKKEDDDEEIAENLPPLTEGDGAEVKRTDCERRLTQPPPEYTEALLLKDMRQPGKYVSEVRLKKIFRKEVGLGTQATRAQMIETLLMRDYVVRRKKRLLPTDKGCLLIDTLRRYQTPRILASPEETARWEARLEQIALGQDSDEDFIEEIKEMVTKMIEEFKAGPGGLGSCPVCGGRVILGRRNYGCANWRKSDGECRFVLPGEIAGKKVSADIISSLLSSRQAGPFSGFASDQGEPFNALLRLVEAGGGWQVRLEITGEAPPAAPAETESGTVLGRCPQCGGNVVEHPKSYGCEKWKEEDGGCRFVIWKETAKKWIAPAMAAELLAKGSIGPLDHFISKKGKPFSAALKLVRGEDQWEVRFDFGNGRDDDVPKKPIGKCPACGGDVTEGPRAYGCANWREADGGCKFVIWRTIAQKEISPAVAVELLEKGETDQLFGFVSKKGSAFSARLRLDTNGPPPPKVVFEFSETSS